MLDYTSRIYHYTVVAEDARLNPVDRHDSWPGMVRIEAMGPDNYPVLQLYIDESHAANLRDMLTAALRDYTEGV